MEVNQSSTPFSAFRNQKLVFFIDMVPSSEFDSQDNMPYILVNTRNFTT